MEKGLLLAHYLTCQEPGYIPYIVQRLISRCIIFTFFVDWFGTAKIRCCEKAKIEGVANRISLICKNCFHETLQITRSAKIVPRKFGVYVILLHGNVPVYKG